MSNREALIDISCGYSKAKGWKIYQVTFVPEAVENRHSMHYDINVAALSVEEAISTARNRIAPKWPVILVSVELLATETFPLSFD
jgi:hypothetical protein